MWDLRSFNYDDSDYEQMLAIHNTTWTHWPTTTTELKFNDEARDPNVFFERVVAEVNGEIKAYAILCDMYWADAADQYFTTCTVHPRFRNQGMASEIYRGFRIKLAEKHAKSVIAKTREDLTTGIQFLENKGFGRIMRYPRSHLDVDGFNYETYKGLADRLETEGLKLRSIEQLKNEDRDWKQKLLDVTHAILRDVPQPEPFKELSLDQYEKAYLENPSFCPPAWWVAVNCNEYVGLSNLWVRTEHSREFAHTGLTGVRRDYRRRGICTALKVKTFEFAKKFGTKIIETDNEESNPMYQINLKLGFKPQPAWLDYRIEF